MTKQLIDIISKVTNDSYFDITIAYKVDDIIKDMFDVHVGNFIIFEERIFPAQIKTCMYFKKNSQKKYYKLVNLEKITKGLCMFKYRITNDSPT